MTSSEIRRSMLIAGIAATAMFSFLMVYDEPMSATYTPALVPYPVEAPRFFVRVGRRDNFALQFVCPGEALRYLDRIRAAIDYPEFPPLQPVLSDASEYEPTRWKEPVVHVNSRTIETAISRIHDNRRIEFATLVRPEEYDFGHYKSMAVPGVDREDVHGFLHLPLVFGTSLVPSAPARGVAERVDSAVNRFTHIQTTEDPHIYLDSPRLLDYPILFITSDLQFDLSPRERENLYRYFEAGGFIIMDNPSPRVSHNWVEASFRKMVRDIAGSQGKFVPLPNDHAIYHSLFDFDKPPIGREIGDFLPISAANLPRGPYTWYNRLSEYVYYLEGFFYKGRLAGVLTNKGYSIDLADELGRYKYSDTIFFNIFSLTTPEYRIPTFKFVANMVVYALLDQEGMTQRRMHPALAE